MPDTEEATPTESATTQPVERAPKKPAPKPAIQVEREAAPLAAAKAKAAEPEPEARPIMMQTRKGTKWVRPMSRAMVDWDERPVEERVKRAPVIANPETKPEASK